MTPRYVIRPGRNGHDVIDLWSGQPAPLAGAAQAGLSRPDAEHTAALLNKAHVDPDDAPRGSVGLDRRDHLRG